MLMFESFNSKKKKKLTYKQDLNGSNVCKTTILIIEHTKSYTSVY